MALSTQAATRLYRSSDGKSIQLDLDDETGLRDAPLQSSDLR